MIKEQQNKDNTKVNQPDTKIKPAHWWRILLVVFVFTMFVVVAWFVIARSSNNGSNNETVNYQVMDRVTRADVTIKTGSGMLVVNSNNAPGLVKAQVEGENLRLQKDSSVDGGTQRVSLSNDSNNWFMGDHKSSWDITLDEFVLQKLTIEAGASGIDADLSNVKLTDLSVKVGASRSVITVGANQPKFNINYESGAGSMTLRIPKASGVFMKLDDGLGTREFEDLYEISEREYKSKNYDMAQSIVNIDASTGVASFKIQRY